MRLRNGTLVERLPWGSRVTLPNGTVVLGAPHETESYRETAQRLGYGDDVLQLARDHDPLHAVLADWLNLPDSPALRVAAGLDGPSALAGADEDVVMTLQRFCRLAGVKLFIDAD
jgi:hypothetical protein